MTGRLESDPELAIRSGLDALQELALKQAGIQEEWQKAWTEFSQEGPPFEKAQSQGSSACGRFREWFLLERHSPGLLGTPMDRLTNDWRETHPDFAEHVEPLLQSSFTGIFEVGDLVENQGAWLRDITGFGEFALQDPLGAPQLHTGDLLVGRLFSISGSLHVASGSATWLRSPDLSEPLERDLTRLYGEGAKILRLAAADLEAMFFHPSAPHRKAIRSREPKPEQQNQNAIAEAREFLKLTGWSYSKINTWFERLRRNPIDPMALAASPSDAVGQALEQFAFDTQVDLSEARRILTQAWMATFKERSEAEAQEPTESEVSDDAKQAIDRFAAAKATGGDLEIHFQELEQSLGLPIGSDDEDPGKAPDFPGVIGAMVAEFQWDLERQNKGHQVWAERLQPFAEYNRTIGAFEDLSRREVLAFCCFWTLEQKLFTEPDTALETVQALEQFTLWAQEEHEMPLHEDCKELLGSLRTSLPRIVGLNQKLPEPPKIQDEETGQLFSVGELLAKENVVLLDRNGNQYTSIVPESVQGDLQLGDHLRATLDIEGHAQVFCIYPPQAAELHG
ncbi:MAG: hypothetical protein ACI89E_001374 [Planctomycetota bacterium]|jgi:hypothetical protein